MTDEQKIEKALKSYENFRKLQGEYFQQKMDYAKALGLGIATESQRLKLIIAKEAYYAA